MAEEIKVGKGQKKLFKKYADGEVRHVLVNDRAGSVEHMMANGFFLTEDEAELGRVFTEEEEKAATTEPAKPAKTTK